LAAAAKGISQCFLLFLRKALLAFGTILNIALTTARLSTKSQQVAIMLGTQIEHFTNKMLASSDTFWKFLWRTCNKVGLSRQAFRQFQLEKTYGSDTESLWS